MVPTVVRAGHVPPATTIAGLDAGEAPQARMRDLLRDCGFSLPEETPGLDLRPARADAWPGLDLPLAVALLAAAGLVPRAAAEGAVFVGTLDDSGQIGPVVDVASIAAQSVVRGLPLFCADYQAEEAAEIGGDVYALHDIHELVEHLADRTRLVPTGAVWGTPSPHPVGELAENLSSVEAPVGIPGAPGPASSAEPTPAVLSPHFPSIGPFGHRGRMRTRVLERGATALADYELLEMLLFLAFQRGDTKPLAKRLINRFGSFGAVIAASGQALLTVEGVNNHVATTMMTVHEAAVRMGRAELMARPLLNNWDRLITYLNTVLAHEPVEHFRVLFLDTRNRLLADEQQGRGTVNHTPVYPREVVRRALELHATAMILVHNPPSGDPTPSRNDVEMTAQVRRAAEALSIVLHDHIIVAPGGWRSLQQAGLLK